MQEYVQMQIDTSEQETNAEYQKFVDKFKPKKTTDDCYTPPMVYEAVKNWACEKYGIDENNIVRPFYPGGDYENYDYKPESVVLDNPPFSIVSKICEFYLKHGIQFFLFAPSLTAFSGVSTIKKMNHIITEADIIYENGARVKTAFVTNFGGDVVACTAPDLREKIKAAMAETMREKKRELPGYQYPNEVLTAAILQKLVRYGVEFEVRRNECVHIRRLDAQVEEKKAIYGGGLLLNVAATERRAAAERAAAERAAAKKANKRVYDLSERERGMITEMEAAETCAE